MFSALVATSLLTLGQAAPADKTIVIPGRAPIDQALFNPDGRRLYFATQGGVEGHDIETGKRLFDVLGSRQIVCSPKGDLLAAIHINIGMTSIGGNIIVFDAATGKLLLTQSGTSALFSPDSRWLISHSNYTWGHPGTDAPPKTRITDLRTGKTHLAELPAEKGIEPGFRARAFGGASFFTKDSKAYVQRTANDAGQITSVVACDLETGKPLALLPKNEDMHVLLDPRYSADNKRFVNNWTVHDVERGKPISKFELPKEPKSSGWEPKFQISGDGKAIFSVTSIQRRITMDEKTGRSSLTMASHLHIWDADTGKRMQAIEAKRVATLPGATFKKLGQFQNSEPRFAVNPQGTLAVDYDPEAVTVWDIATGKALRKFRTSGHTSRPERLRFSPDGKWIASSSSDGDIALWNARTGEPGPTLDRAAHLGDICFRPKSDELVGVGHGVIYVWDIKTGAMKRTLDNQGYLLGVECHPDGKRAVVADHRNDLLTLLDLDTGKAVHNPRGGNKSLAFNPDGAVLLTLDGYGNVTLWDTAAGEKLQYWRNPKHDPYRHTAQRAVFLPGAERYLLCENNAVAIVDAATGKRVFEHSIKNEARKDPSDADVHPDGKRYIVSYWGDLAIEERDIETGKVLRSYPGYGHGTIRARYSPDGTRLATAGYYAHELRIHQVPAR